MKKLKIALVSPFPPSKGTLNEYAFHLVKQMKEKDDISEIVILSDKIDETYEAPTDGKCKITISDVWRFNSWKAWWNIIRAVKKSKADVAFFNIQFLSFGDKRVPATLGLMAPMILRMLGVPTVVLLHNIIETVNYESAGITKNPILKWIFNVIGTIITQMILFANMVAVTMPKYVEILEKKYKAKNVALIPHGSFEVPPMPDFDKVDSSLQVMTFGKFGTYKKVEGMIEAVDLVRRETGKEIEIVIAGTDNPNKIGYLEGVRRSYAHIENIKFTGYVEEEDVSRIFNDSTVVVFPYTSTTGSSGVLHQAGSYGKAVVMPKIGDLKELVEEEGYAGEFFEPGDVRDMADSIKRLILGRDYRIDIAKKNFVAASSLPMADIADWYLMHFDYLVNGKKLIVDVSVK